MVSTPPYSSRTWSSRSCVEQFGIYKDEDQLTGYNYYKNSTRFVRTFVVAAILGVVTLLVCLMVNDIAKTTSGTSTKRDRDGMHVLLATPRPPRRAPTNQTTTNYTNITSIPSTTTLTPEIHSSTQTTTTIFSADHTPYLTVESATKILRGENQIHEHTALDDEEDLERIGEDTRKEEEESKDYSVEYSSEEGERENVDDDEERLDTETSNDEESIEYDEEEEEEEEDDGQEESIEQEDEETEEVTDSEEGERMSEALPYTIEKPEAMIDPNNLTEDITFLDDSKSEAITYRMNHKHVRGKNNNYTLATPALRTRQYVSNPLYGGNAPKIQIHLPYNKGSSKSNVGYHSHPGQQHYFDHTSYGVENGDHNRRNEKFDKNVNQRFQNPDGNRYLKKKKRKRLPLEKQIALSPPLRRHSFVEEYQTPILIDYDTHKGLHINHNLVNSIGGGDGIRRVSIATGQHDDMNPMGENRRQKNIKRNSDQVSIARMDDEIEHRQIDFPPEQITFDYGNVQQSSRGNDNYQTIPSQSQVLNENGRQHRKQSSVEQMNRIAEERSKPVHEYVDNGEKAENLTPLQEKIEDAAFETYAKYWNPYLEDLNTDVMVSEATEARIINRTPKRDKNSPKPFVTKGTTKHEPNSNLKKKLGDSQTSATKKYPQLTNYHYPKDAKNIRDIIKYLTNIDETKTKQETRLEKAKKPLGTIMKLKGVYLDHGEDIYRYNEDKNDENVHEELKKDEDFGFVYKNNDHFTSLNGHAYIADPFYQYKPENMADINSLVSPDFRFPTPTNEALFKHTLNHLNEKKRIGLSHNPNTKYFPKPPISYNSRPISAPSSHVVKQVPGKYTTAIYRPLGATRFPGNDKHENTVQKTVKATNPKIVNQSQLQLEEIKKKLARQGKSKPKPLSVMLDIYPLLDHNLPEPARPQLPPNRVKFNPINFGGPVHRPVNGYVQRPYQMLRKGVGNHKRKDEGSGERYKTQMVVHLNLHPKKKNQNDDYYRADERKNTNSRTDINRRKMNVYQKRRHYNEDYEGEIKRDNDDDYYEDDPEDTDDEETFEENFEGEGEVVDNIATPDVTGESNSSPPGIVEEDDVKGKHKDEEDEDEDHQSSGTTQYRGVTNHEDEDDEDDDEDDVMKGRELTLVLNADFMRPQDRNEYFLRRGKAVPLIGEKTGGENQTQEIGNVDHNNVTGGLKEGVEIGDKLGVHEESTITRPFQITERQDEQGNEGEMIINNMNLNDVQVDVSKSEIEMTNSTQDMTEVYEDVGMEPVSEKPFDVDTESAFRFIETPNGTDEIVGENNTQVAADNIMKLHGFTIVQVPTGVDRNKTEFGGGDNSTDGFKQNPMLLLLKTELENGGEVTEEENSSETEEERKANVDVVQAIEKDNEDVRFSGENTEVNTQTVITSVDETTLPGNIYDYGKENYTFSRREDQSIVEQMYSDILAFSNTQNETVNNGSKIMDQNSIKYSASYSSNVNELIH